MVLFYLLCCYIKKSVLEKIMLASSEKSIPIRQLAIMPRNIAITVSIMAKQVIDYCNNWLQKILLQ